MTLGESGMVKLTGDSVMTPSSVRALTCRTCGPANRPTGIVEDEFGMCYICRNDECAAGKEFRRLLTELKPNVDESELFNFVDKNYKAFRVAVDEISRQHAEGRTFGEPHSVPGGHSQHAFPSET